MMQSFSTRLTARSLFSIVQLQMKWVTSRLPGNVRRGRRAGFFLALLVINLLMSTSIAVAAEPVMEFLNGLRERRYYDSALFYIEQMENNKSLPPELVQVLSYERGQTLLQSAKSLLNLDAQRKQLDAAQAAFEVFVKANPNHALAGRANTARGQILLEKARVDIWDADKPSNEGNRQNRLADARKAIGAARKIFEEARKQHETNWRKYPAYIPEEQKEERAARASAEEQFIRAQLDLAMCTYWEAQAYDKTAPERKKLLQDSAFAFESIHQQNRSQIGGLFARIWQGKCFEEQGDAEGIRIALGIYGEILGHDSSSQAMRTLQDSALRFRLICLNTEHRKDNQLVIQEAETWLRNNRDRARTDVGLGIEWELARAMESAGTDRNNPENARKNSLTQALNRARSINRYPGELKNPSSGMIQRILVLLNRDVADPKDFDTAYGNGGTLYDQVAAVNSQIRKLQQENKQAEARKQYDSLMATAAEMTRMYDLGLKLATPATDPNLVNIARLRLAYGYLLQKRDFEAAIIAEDQILRHSGDNSTIAQEAGYLLMAAFDHAYSDAPEGKRDFEERQVIAAANLLCEKWPESDRANDARNTVAKIYWNNNDLLTAAEWWLKIPKGTSQYADAQVRAGKAYWRQYVTEASKPEGERPSQEDMAKWKTAAINHLTIGLDEAEKQIPDDAPFPDDLVGAKLTLVSIRNLDGLYQQKDPKGPLGALELLQKDPHSVLKEVDLPKGQKRPQDPAKAKSRQMASFAYQQLLRAYVGTKNLDEARKARIKLEEVASGGDAAALTQVFVDFGQELERELERLRAAGDKKRLDDVRSGFEAFLNELFQRKEGQTIYSLLWIGETFSSLADASADEPAKATDFYKKAAGAYQEIIDSAAKDSNFANPQQVVACKLRLVNCLKNQKDFAKAEGVILDVLKTNPNAPDAQFEASSLYQAWGNEEKNADKFNIALYGKKGDQHIWGWTYTSQMLQQTLFRQKEERVERLHFDARYNQAEAEKQFGLTINDPKESRLHLDRALSNINSFQRVSKRWPDEEYQRFNTLYRAILQDLGEPTIDLPRELASTEPSAEMKAANGAAQEQAAAPVVATAPVKETQPAEAESGGSGYFLFGLLLVVTLGCVGFWYWYQSKNQLKPKMTIDAGNDAAVVSAIGNAASHAVPHAPPGEFGPPLTAMPQAKQNGSAHNRVSGPAFPGFDPISGDAKKPTRAPAPKPSVAASAAVKPAAVRPTAAKPAAPVAGANVAPKAAPTAAPQSPRPKADATGAVPQKPAAAKPAAPPQPTAQQLAAQQAAAQQKTSQQPPAQKPAVPKPVAPVATPKPAAPIAAKPKPAAPPTETPAPKPPAATPAAPQAKKPATEGQKRPEKSAATDSPFPLGNPLPPPVKKSEKPSSPNPFNPFQ